MNVRVAILHQKWVTGEGKKRPRSPEFVPDKRLKQDALRLAFVNNKKTIKANCTHFTASVDGSPTVEGLEAALAAWAAKLCGRPLGHELSPDDESRYAAEVDAAKGRELDAWCKFQVFSPVPQAKVAKDVVETRWVPPGRTWMGSGLSRPDW